MELKFRNLKADEIEIRIGNVAKDKTWITLLLYQDSRVAMDLLDEVVGPMNWQRKHMRDNANCMIEIWDNEKKQWVMKEDTGVESFSDKEKGLASDSFKRSAVNWGIGRSLYSAPKIFLYGNSDVLKNDKYFVNEIGYDENDKINKLIITDKKDNVVFQFPKIGEKVTTTTKPVQPQSKPKTISEAQRKRLFAIANGNNEVAKQVLERYNYKKTEQILVSDYEKICNEIKAEINM